MEESSSLENYSHITASSSLAEASIRVLKHNEAFAVFNRYGDIVTAENGEQGVYFQGTRHLSHLKFLIAAQEPLLLSSSVNEDNATLAIDLTNSDVVNSTATAMNRGTIHVNRTKFLHEHACHEQFCITNYGLETAQFSVQLRYSSDFADIFEVRGHKRGTRGEILKPAVGTDAVKLQYFGLDAVKRVTLIRFSARPQTLRGHCANFEISLAPHTSYTLEVDYDFRDLEPPPCRTESQFMQSYRHALTKLHLQKSVDCQITTTNEQFNDWLKRSASDVHMMLSETKWGPYPYAGVPWFSAPFGRDGIITAFELLWVNPNIARSVLGFLANHQATDFSDKNDSEPGKILHEARKGELASLDEIPFRQYYGSVDSTPLFVMLAGAYLKRTGDRAFIASIWENLLMARKWIDHYGDRDKDGFVEYSRHSEEGLSQQGWKDSNDSVFHSNGDLAVSPVALCEVQGYVFAAKEALAEIAGALGEDQLAIELAHQAIALKRKFAEVFWQSDMDFYALALDRNKNPCRVLSSNAGHCLFCGIAEAEHAAKIAAKLLENRFFSGWGIRTIADGEARYNPMVYHNGTVWPHDNALIAAGLARYGYKKMALKVLTGLFDVSVYVDLNRLPELFCGFPRMSGRGPTLYPVSCAPQAWAAGAVFMLLGACLGLDIDAEKNRLYFHKPAMPDYLEKVTLKNLIVAPGQAVSLELINHRANVGINVLSRDDGIEIIAVS